MTVSSGAPPVRRGMLFQTHEGKLYRVTRRVSDSVVEIGPFRWWHTPVPTWMLLLLSGLSVLGGLLVWHFFRLG